MGGEEEVTPEYVEQYDVTVAKDTIQPVEPVVQPIPETSVEVVTEIKAEVDDNKWFGVPPVGEQPLPGKWNYVLLIFLVMVIEIGIWAVYRYFSAPYFESFGTLTFYLAHIIAAPTIHLIPILIFWRFFRKEKGLPFKFTKKLLMSAVIVGFVGAIIWRILQELSYDALSSSAGGNVSGTFNFFNLFAASNVTLFSVMTFVHFFIVGPVEELEFRSFAFDQSARVIPNWQALLFSSVLFGCSHIPIALFVYQFPPHIFGVALFGWISAGVVFGALYMWSRNIFACIVMHGMGNWQLSVYYFQSTETGAMSVSSVVAVDMATTIIADGAMILIFYLVHRFYWQPHRRGEPAFGGRFVNLQKYVHEHDFMQRPLQTTAVFLVVFIVATCGIIMGLTYVLGESDLSLMTSAGTEVDELVLDEEIANWTLQLDIDEKHQGTLFIPSGGFIISEGNSVESHEFEVVNGTYVGYVNVTFEGTKARADFDLRVYGPGDKMVGESATEETNEYVELDEKDFNRTGYGIYTAEVENYSSFNIEYTLTIQTYIKVLIEGTDEDDGE